MKILSVTLSIIFLFGCLSGCAPNTISFSARDVEFVEDGPSADPYLPGQLTYTPQTDKAQHLTYSGEAASVTVVDEDGGEWTLSIPAGALPEVESVEITASPIADGAFSEGGAGFIGLQLEPQGLIFKKPVTLTYQGEGRQFPLVLLSDSDGNSLEPLPAQGSDTGFSVEFDHFSTITAADADPSPDEALALAEEVLTKSEKCLKEKLKVKVPDIDLEDMRTSIFDQLKQTERDLLCPEAGYLAALATLPEMLSRAGQLDAAYQRRISSVYQAMSSRFYAKIDAFIDKYEDEPEQAFVMLRVYYYNKVLAVLPIGVNLHADLSEGEQQSVREQVDKNLARYEEISARWGNAAWEKGMEELRDHNFRVLMAVYVMTVEFPIRHEAFQSDAMISQAQDAMAFELSFEGTIKDSQPNAQATWSVQGRIPLSFYFELQDEDVHKVFVWTGTGSTSFTGYQSDTGMELAPGDTPVEAEVKLLGSSPDFQLALRPQALSPDKLIYSDKDGTYTVSQMQRLLASILVEYYDAGRYEVVTDLDNDATTQTKIDARLEETRANYTLKMTHTPH